jgi:hypothetical protein
LVKLIKYQAKDDNTFHQSVEQTTQEDTLERKKRKPTKGTRGQGDNMEMIVLFLELRKTYLCRG